MDGGSWQRKTLRQYNTQTTSVRMEPAQCMYASKNNQDTRQESNRIEVLRARSYD